MDSTFFYTGSNHERHCNARCHASSFTYQGEASLLPSNGKKITANVLIFYLKNLN